MTDPVKSAEQRVSLFDSAELMPRYLSALNEFGSIVIPVSGTSMAPFLGHRRDTVTLVPADGKKLVRGDIILYKREGKDGLCAYIMHRIIGKDSDGFILCGDAQTVKERGVRKESVIAVAAGAERRGRSLGVHSPVWLFYKHIWRILRPVRPLLLKAFSGKRG